MNDEARMTNDEDEARMTKVEFVIRHSGFVILFVIRHSCIRH